MTATGQTSPPILDLIVELATRGEAVNELSIQLRDAVSQSPAELIVPNTIGTVDQLRSQLERLTKRLAEFEAHMGIQRRRPNRRKSDKSARMQDLRGSTHTMRIVDLVGLLSAQRKTGTLWIHSDSERFVLELVDGAVVHLVSDNPRPEHRIGTILVSTDRISQEKLDEFLNRYGPQDGPIGKLLQDAELVTEGDLRHALQVQVQELFQRIFELENAVFCFRAGAVSDLEVRVCLNTTELMLNCARRDDERRRDQGGDEQGEPSGLDAIGDASMTTIASTAAMNAAIDAHEAAESQLSPVGAEGSTGSVGEESDEDTDDEETTNEGLSIEQAQPTLGSAPVPQDAAVPPLTWPQRTPVADSEDAAEDRSDHELIESVGDAVVEAAESIAEECEAAADFIGPRLDESFEAAGDEPSPGLDSTLEGALDSMIDEEVDVEIETIAEIDRDRVAVGSDAPEPDSEPGEDEAS